MKATTKPRPLLLILRDQQPHLRKEYVETQLLEVLTGKFPEFTVDMLVCRPRDALRYCELVGERFGLSLPEEAILRALMAMRKNKKTPTATR